MSSHDSSDDIERRNTKEFLTSIGDRIPIIIVSYNNHKYVSNTIRQLNLIDAEMLQTIMVMDNNSTDEGTIQYLKTCEKIVHVIRNKTNDGPWVSIGRNRWLYDLMPNKFALTDPDLEFNSKLPTDFLRILSNLSDEHNTCSIGFALDISEPDKMFTGEYHDGKTIVEWESQFWNDKVGTHHGDNLYRADIDTTFALIKKDGLAGFRIRAAGKFTAKHIPWYIDNVVYTPRELAMYYKTSRYSSITQSFEQNLAERGIVEVYKNGAMMLIDTSIDNNSNFWKNIYSTWESDTFAVFDEFLSPDRDFLDIGGWVGTTCIYGSFKSKRVITVEADPHSAISLLRNASLNNDNITLINKAIYKEDDASITFGTNKHLANSKWNDSTSQIHSGEPSDGDVVVKTITVSTIIEKYELTNVSLIKVDIEGGEEHILNDLFEVQNKLDVPMYISFHYTWWENKDLSRFNQLSASHIERIQRSPFCSILFRPTIQVTCLKEPVNQTGSQRLISREELLAELSRADNNSMDMVIDVSKRMTGKTFHHHYHVLYDLRTLLGPDKKVYAEIGTFCGGSLSLMLRHAYDTEYHCIDPLIAVPKQDNILMSNVDKFDIHQRRIEIHRRYSGDVDLLSHFEETGLKVDILFIDGDHTYNGVLADFTNYEKFVNPGGFIVFDDYQDHAHSPDVKRMVDDLVPTIKSRYNIIGSLPNVKKAYDILNLQQLNEFIIQKRYVVDESTDVPTSTLTLDSDIRFGIGIATYCRPSGKTPMYIRKCLDSIVDQVYTKWDVVIVGDKYEPKGEILGIVNEYRSMLRRRGLDNQIIYIQNYHVERDHIKNSHSLWMIAGAGSMNVALNYIRDNGYRYYCHLDDDDYWMPDHLLSFQEIYSKYGNCIFANSQSMHITCVKVNNGAKPHRSEGCSLANNPIINFDTRNNTVLPNFKCEVKPNNYVPGAQKLTHSSASFRCDIIPYDYFTTFNESEAKGASDAIYLNQVRDFLLLHPQYCSIYTSRLTCAHPIEQGK